MPQPNYTRPTDGSGFTTTEPLRATDPHHPHRWRCPFCDASRVVGAHFDSTDESVVADRATAALRAHILASGNDGHGPTHAYPADFDSASLDDHVESLDGKVPAGGRLSDQRWPNRRQR